MTTTLVRALAAALALGDTERRQRMTRMRSVVFAHTVHDWATTYLAHLEHCPRGV